MHKHPPNYWNAIQICYRSALLTDTSMWIKYTDGKTNTQYMPSTLVCTIYFMQYSYVVENTCYMVNNFRICAPKYLKIGEAIADSLPKNG